MSAKSQVKSKYLWSGWILLILFLVMTSYLSFPAGAFAQSFSVKFNTLSVSLWPEFDRPETLVIYRAQLDTDTPLPAELSFRLPGHVNAMHAVAYEQDGALLSVNPDSIRLSAEGDDSLLTFSTPSPNIQFEYYDPIILTKQDQTRTLNFNFSTLYPIETTTFEVQQPPQSEGFLLTPAPDNTFIGSNGLQYSSLQVADIASNESYSLSATYQRNTDDVLAPGIANQPVSQPDEATLLSASVGNDNTNYLAYSLIGAGIVLFVGAGGYWWFKQTKADINPRSLPQKHKRPPVRRKKRQTARGKADNQSATPIPVQRTSSPAASFCYRCGVGLREDSNFCHNCGAERR